MDESVLGEPKAATGAPITIGFITDGKSAAIDNSGEVDAAQAGVKYVNEYLGGIGGRPIELEVCDTHQTPSGATECATKLANDKVPVVLNNVSGQSTGFFPVLQQAGIPLVQLGGLDPDMATKPGAFILTNALGLAIAGPAGLARDANIKQAGILVIDVPAASGPLKTVAPLFYKNANVTADVIPVPVGTADMTPQVQAGISNGDGQFSVIGDPVFCTSAVKAMRTLGFGGPIVVIPTCIDSSAPATDGAFEGALMMTAATNSPDDPDFQKFQAVMAKYAAGVDTGGVTPGGYAVVVAFVRAMAGLSGEMTPASVTATFKAMPKTPLPMGGGVTFQCNGQQVPIMPNVCSTDVLVTTLDRDAQPTGFKLYPTADLLKISG